MLLSVGVEELVRQYQTTAGPTFTKASIRKLLHEKGNFYFFNVKEDEEI